MTKKLGALLGVAAIAGIAGTTNAAVFTADSGNHHGIAVVTVEATDIKIVLTNNTTGTHDAGDLLTAFSFTGISGLTILHQPGDTSAATLRTLASASSFTDVAADNNTHKVGWHIGNPKGFGISLNFSAPDQGLISTSYAASVTPSLTGNHNPFVLTTGTWYLSKGSFTSDDQITNADFRFGTDLETDIPGIPGGGDTPEPASLGVLSIGAVGLLARRRRKA